MLMVKEFLVMSHGETVSSRIEVSPEKFEEVKRVLEPLGIKFRTPRR